jgi:intron-binding protein aquarius
VTADVCYSLSKYSKKIQAEWDDIRPTDTLFLVALVAEPVEQEYGSTTIPTYGPAFAKKYGIKHIRGCQVHQLLDDEGNYVHNFIDAKVPNEDGEARIESGLRTVRVALDPNQHILDTSQKDEYEIYGTFNILVKRPRSENTFKSILETIRDLMQSELVVPDWIHDVLLGYGRRDGAHYTQMANPDVTIDFRDTFLDWKHLQESFPDVTKN